MKLRYRKDETYTYDYLKIIKYREDKYKAIQFKFRVKKSGFEAEKKPIKIKAEKKEITEKEKKDEEYLRQSISRTQKTIHEYALCNDFEYFVTLTFDRSKWDSTNLKELKRIVGQWLSNYKKRRNPNLIYLLIPELHPDKEHFHIHGLISGVEDITEFRKSKKGIMRFNWSSWHNKFGYTSIEKVDNIDAISKYITKYITKDLIHAFNQHRYICSKGLNKPETVFEMTHYVEDMPCDFENDFVRIKHLDNYEEFYKELLKHHDYMEDTGGVSMWN